MTCAGFWRKDGGSTMIARILELLQDSGRASWRAFMKYLDTDGEQRAASFAYYALFAIFPLVLLFVMIGSVWYDYKEVANHVLDLVGRYVPAIEDTPGSRNAVLSTVETVVESRRGAGSIAAVVIVWSSLGFFHALVRGVNRAWGTIEYPWYKLPFKNLLMVAIVGSALLIGIFASPVIAAVEAALRARSGGFVAPALGVTFSLMRSLIPLLVLFYGLIMFYRFAPRRKTQFKEVWVAALAATLLLKLLQKLFVLYATNFTSFNAVYGAFGGIMAFLLWVYLSGSVIILGGCLCAATAELKAEKALPDAADEEAKEAGG